ncbi:minichromosome maintenance protein MCM [Methanomicrobium antiquum]|uniref:DNA helicase n=1 Tax=Methanomicrobium antiquum TaxID=487686 RepID=A0AAF0G0S0_9EURY|nr:minichromosome maintenance protein MCM [Methanomicrobium antiquum]MDD3977180.1 minichromosome maintenance protein MCM [Methanomicrobium sp.]WFN37939.1 minichromosome maintenance protein MCM [Methanomicrobium antiquum]
MDEIPQFPENSEPEATVTDKAADWSKFLKKHYKAELGEIAREFPYNRSLVIDYQKLEKWGKRGLLLADELLKNPGKVLSDVKDAIKQNNLIFTKDEEEKADDVNVRFIRLPKKIDVRDIRAHHINTFLSVEGIIRKTTEVRPRLTYAIFRCLNCGTLTPPYSQGFGKFQEPYRNCAQCERQTKMELVPQLSKFVDVQKLRIQESPEGLRGGEQPETLDVDLQDDLVATASPGDRVVINGILRSIQRVSQGSKSSLFDIYLEANSLEVGEKEFEEVAISDEDEQSIVELSRDPELYRKFSHSIAPSIYGNDEVKEAISLILFGGIVKSLPDGSHLRGDIHMLLVGDPGIAKSQMLRYVIKLSPRGIYTSGKSSTSAGLTATAVKDEFGDGRWTLEAGALVLADMGIAAVDEMDKMTRDDRSSLHEAMEQQTISIAKAGITATLRSRCALLGAANPKMGRFDEYAPIAEQINMPPSLLSRFDLIFVMRDKPNSVLDRAIGEHILKAHEVGEIIEHNKKNPMEEVDDDFIQEKLAPVLPEIDPLLFRKYIAYSKRNCFPLLRKEAKEKLIAYYLSLRDMASDNSKPVPVTARQLEALVRLAEASARIRLSDEIDESDAERVIRIVDRCLRDVAYDPETGSFDIDKLVTGIPKQRRDIIREIKEAVKSRADDNGYAQIDDVIQVLIQKGHERDDIRKRIDDLLRNGEAMEPRHGLIKLI